MLLPKTTRFRGTSYLRHVASHPCLICGHPDTQAHHLTFAQPKARGLKVGDNWAVPLCAVHHADLHAHPPEREWWAKRGIDSVLWALNTYMRWAENG